MTLTKISLIALAMFALPAAAYAEDTTTGGAADTVKKQAEGCPAAGAVVDESKIPDECKDKNNATTDAERDGKANDKTEDTGNNQTGNQEDNTKPKTDASVNPQNGEGQGGNNQSGGTVN